jgi:hypothetical protein
MGFGYAIHNQVAVGFITPYGQTGSSTQTYLLDAATEWLGISFIAPPGGATINKVLVYASAVGGAPLTDAKLQCDIYDDASGVPNASLANSVTVTAKPAAAAWVEFTGFTLALTGGVQYWIVLKNIEADPAAKNITYKVSHSFTNSYSTVGPHTSKMTVDSGTTWATSVKHGVMGFRLEFSDGFYGFPLSDNSIGSSTYGIYDDREHGAYFTTPASGQLVVAGAIGNIRVVGSPGNGIKFRLYKGTELIDTSKEVLVTNIQSTTHVKAMFTAQRKLDAATVYRLVAMHTGSTGNTSNCYEVGFGTLHDHADSRALGPLKGWQGTYTTDSTASPPSFSEVTTVVPCISLLLDTDGGEIYAPASGGGSSPRFGDMTGGLK